MALTAGTYLGPYAVTALIGQGGMGEVNRARDTKLDPVRVSNRRTGSCTPPIVENRIQVFSTDGTFVKEEFIARQTLGFGVTYEVECLPDNP